MIRKAKQTDLDAVEALYCHIHTAEEQGILTTGWQRGIYPTRQTAVQALARQDLFVLTGEKGETLGAAILNQQQVDVYAGAPWEYDAADREVMVMHTLAIDPAFRGMGLGKAFEQFYCQYALENGCRYLRIDTNVRNTAARWFYRGRGYREIAVRPCLFNGLPDVELVLLEKKL